MTESDLSPIELAKTALSLAQDGSDSEDEILALSLATSAVALHLLKQRNRSKRQRVVNTTNDDADYRKSPSPNNFALDTPKMMQDVSFEIQNEVDETVHDKEDEGTGTEAPIHDFKIEVNPLLLLSDDGNQGDTSADLNNSQANNSEDSSLSSSGKRRKRQWSKFEDDRRRVLLRLSSNDSMDLFCAEPKITDYMNIFLDGLKMDISTFNLLLSLVRKDIEHQNTCMRMTVASEQRLAVLLRYLSTGESYISIEKAVKISRSFLCVNIPALCKALWSNLKDQYLKVPSCEGEWASKAEEFDTRWRFPLCLGTLTRRHFKFKTPRAASVLALVDANNKFLHIEIEKEDDGLYLAQENVPPPQSIGNNRALPYVFIAENGFELDEHIMTPFQFTDTVARRVFNARLKAASRVADQTFNILTERFKILSTPMNLLQQHIDDAIRACCVLHNFLMQNNPDLYAAGVPEDNNDLGPQIITLDSGVHYNENAEAIREEFAEYFANEGNVPTFDVKLFEDEGMSASNVLLDMFSI